MSAYIGDRLREARKRAGLTQHELARASGVSLSLIRKLEQGDRRDTRLETLHRLAVALETTTTALILEHADEQDVAVASPEQWNAVRAALDGTDGEIDEAPTAEGVRAGYATATELYRAGDFAGIGAMLPSLIRDADALADIAAEGPTLRMRVLTMTGRLMTQTRQYDAARIALARAERDVPDMIHGVALTNVRCFFLLRRGRLSDALTLAATWAEDIEPRRMSRATTLDLAAWGWVLLRTAAAAARDGRHGEAEQALALAESAAAAMGRRQSSLPHLGLLHEYSRSTVEMQRAEYAMVRDQPDEVLRIARGVDLARMRKTSGNRNRHLLDVAAAYTRLRRYDAAMEKLTRVWQDAPQWLPNQRYARDIVGRLVERRRTLTPGMRTLADAVRLPL
ncbi:helix-turn-helix domain-containing protein [Streptomyces sp. 4N509B]|uniref:helix-turn-helix domain-containing protein n=1 Tax=Streptomyces sp. 4N509B TaxID=3457413 RepID=UPI003FD52F53